MNIILDTCTFLWILSGDKALSLKARDLFSNPENEIYLSAASVWEIVVKNKIGKLPLPEPPDTFIKRWRIALQIKTLPITEDSILRLADMPELHKDPFDRVIIAQALTFNMAILTPDKHIRQYQVETEW